MANRRMISKSIRNTDEFLELSHSARDLYDTLTVEADDDGIVAGLVGLMKKFDNTQDDLTSLVEAGFVLLINRCAVLVHWNEANVISPSKKTETLYPDVLSQLGTDVRNHYYIREVGEMQEKSMQEVGEMPTQVNEREVNGRETKRKTIKLNEAQEMIAKYSAS